MSENLTNDIDEDESLDDGREFGHWETRYPRRAWFQIVIELIYLVSLTILSIFLVACSAYGTTEGAEFLPFGQNPDVLIWVATVGSGLSGGCLFAIKWLYHCVAKGYWNADRCIWRFTAPLISGILAVFGTLIVRSELIPIIKGEAVDTMVAAIALAFILGLFSDNLLAALQNFANKTFGTLRDQNEDD